MKTREEVNEIIMEQSKAFGFTVRVNGPRPLEPTADHRAFFRIHAETDVVSGLSDYDKHKFVFDLWFSIGFVGQVGETTPDEVMKYAKEIERAALLVKVLNSFRLRYMEG